MTTQAKAAAMLDTYKYLFAVSWTRRRVLFGDWRNGSRRTLLDFGVGGSGIANAPRLRHVKLSSGNGLDGRGSPFVVAYPIWWRNCIVLYNVTHGCPQMRLQGHSDTIIGIVPWSTNSSSQGLEYDNDGEWHDILFSSSMDQTIRIWSLNPRDDENDETSEEAEAGTRSNCLATLTAHASLDICVDPFDRGIVGRELNSIQVWSIEKQRRIMEFDLTHAFCFHSSYNGISVGNSSEYPYIYFRSDTAVVMIDKKNIRTDASGILSSCSVSKTFCHDTSGKMLSCFHVDSANHMMLTGEEYGNINCWDLRNEREPVFYDRVYSASCCCRYVEDIKSVCEGRFISCCSCYSEDSQSSSVRVFDKSLKLLGGNWGKDWAMNLKGLVTFSGYGGAQDRSFSREDERERIGSLYFVSDTHGTALIRFEGVNSSRQTYCFTSLLSVN